MINIFGGCVYIMYICCMKNKDKKLEVRFLLTEDNYKELKSLADSFEMSISSFTKLRIIELLKNNGEIFNK